MKKKLKKKQLRWLMIPIVIVLIAAAYVVWAVTTATPSIQPLVADKTETATVPEGSLPWPSYGQSAVGLSSAGVIATSGNQTPTPTASTAKLITALCVLQKYPLSVGETGPTITMSPADVALYSTYQAEDGSDMIVAAGEQLSEYQMLEAMLLPSADNIADSLAIWAFGSLATYDTYANQYVKSVDLNSTHVGSDASGFDPSTTSTASDLVKLGEIAMNSPVIASIVAQPSATGIPIVGTIKNVNSLLGKNNVVGIKTGNTNQAGGVFLSASKITVNNQPVTVFTATMQAPTLTRALIDSSKLIVASQGNFSTSPDIASLQSGSVVGEYVVPWSGQTISALASQPIKAISWGGSQVAESINLGSIKAKDQPNQVIGSITTSSSLLKSKNTVDAVLSQSPGSPSKWWTIFHPRSFIHI